MKFEMARIGDYLSLVKGISYTSSNLVDDSPQGLLTINAFTLGGGFKPNSEKSFGGNIPSQYKLVDGDVLLAMTEQDYGLLASPLVINMEETNFETLTYSLDVAKVESHREGLLPQFLFNVLRIPAFRARAAYGDSGSTVQRLPYEALLEQRVPLPDLKVQSAIIKVIRMLDDKIRVNREMTSTLELISQTIFKSWFIDFDPVKAKMAGEKPVGMDAATAALFPDSMEDSELGLIPKGWEIKPLTEMVDILSGGTPKTSDPDYWCGDIPWFSVVDAPQNGGAFFVKTAKTITAAGLNNSAAKLTRPGITIISARGTVGKTVLVALPSAFNQSCYGIEGKYGDYFTFLLTQNQVAGLQNISHGGTFDTITRQTFSAIKVACAPERLLSVFENLILPMYEEIKNLQFESESLSKNRDSLLPRLISGELQIPEEMLAS